MTVYWVTFPVDGILRGRYTTIEADTEREARSLVIDVYGGQGYGFVYATSQAAGIGRHNLRHIPFGPITPGGAAVTSRPRQWMGVLILSMLLLVLTTAAVLVVR